jgi:N-glycosidase YbiA
MITSFSGQHAFLSNFHPSVIEVDGITYPTVEHAFQAMKSTSATEMRHIAMLPTPGQAKRAGRKVALRGDWESVKIDIMRLCLELKFSQPEFAKLLASTAPHDLIEGNTWGDKCWGAVLVGGQWIGENNLGKLLMQIRQDIVP